MTETHLFHADEYKLTVPMLTSLMNEVLSQGLTFRFRAGGSSMSPIIRDGDILSIGPMDGRLPTIGDVVAYKRAGRRQLDQDQLVIHRVIKKIRSGVILLGDNQPPVDADGPVAPEDILGYVTHVERSGRSVRLGLGPERWVIALLSQTALLQPLVRVGFLLFQILPHHRHRSSS